MARNIQRMLATFGRAQCSYDESIPVVNHTGRIPGTRTPVTFINMKPINDLAAGPVRVNAYAHQDYVSEMQTRDCGGFGSVEVQVRLVANRTLAASYHCRGPLIEGAQIEPWQTYASCWVNVTDLVRW